MPDKMLKKATRILKQQGGGTRKLSTMGLEEMDIFFTCLYLTNLWDNEFPSKGKLRLEKREN